jgi:hypothetical protein
MLYGTVCSLELFTHASCYATVSFIELSNIAGTQTLDRSWKSLKDFLPAHMVLKHKDRGHSTLHPSVTQYVFTWCWRCSLENPDPQRFLEALEASRSVALTKRGLKTCQVELVSESAKTPKMVVSRRIFFEKLHQDKGVTALKIKSNKFLLARAHQTSSMIPR